MSQQRAEVSRRVRAPATRIFEIITEPRMHVEIDGSGMLMAAPDAQRLRAVGDTFEMNMDREPLGDIPLGKYTVENVVSRIAPDAALEWSVGAPGQAPFGHVYGYELAAAGAGGSSETDVTLYVDWSGVSDDMLAIVTFPVVPLHMLQRSLEKLADIAERAAP